MFPLDFPKQNNTENALAEEEASLSWNEWITESSKGISGHLFNIIEVVSIRF